MEDFKVKIANIISKYKSVDISQVDQTVIAGKTIKQWKKEVYDACNVDGDTNNYQYIKGKYIEILNLMTKISTILVSLRTKYNIANYMYEKNRALAIAKQKEQNSRIASNILEKMVDSDEKVDDYKMSRLAVALIYDTFETFYAHMYKTVYGLNVIFNIESIVDKSFNNQIPQ